MATIQEALHIAIAHQEAGRLAEAEAVCQAILDAAPETVEALYLGAVLAGQAGRVALAADRAGRAAALRPDLAGLHTLHADTLFAAGRPGASVDSGRRAIALSPEDAAPWPVVARGLYRCGRMAEAVAALERALTLAPDSAEARAQLVLLLRGAGNRLRADGEPGPALAMLARAVALDPADAAARAELGVAAFAARRIPLAVHALRGTLALTPDDAAAWSGMSAARGETGDGPDGVAAAERSLRLRSDLEGAWLNLGAARDQQGLHGPAIAALARAVALDPAHASALGNLASAMNAQGRAEDTVTTLRRALRVRPDDPELHGKYLFALLYLPHQDGPDLLAQARGWGGRFALPDPLPAVSAVAADPERRLRIGFVSGDFRDHAFAFYMEPLFAAFDRERVELALYSTVLAPDSRTARFRDLADVWRDVAGLSDHDLARLVRDDRVDVLVDLASFTAGNRLRAFTLRPAPVQTTVAVNIVTTGLGVFDAVITDRWLCPPGEEVSYAEPIVRLERASWAYRAPAAMPPVTPPPALANGFITFGSFNNPSKLTDETLVMWARVLRAVPGSRLLLKYRALRDPETRALLASRLQAAGVTPDRVEFRPPPSGIAANLADYRDMDIGLDPYPYNGHTTTCEALWSGVPVVARCGPPVATLGVARVGRMMLTAAGLGEWVARDADEYVSKVVALASDPVALAGIRAGLRERVASSELGDVDGLARAMEGVWRTLWRAWCRDGRARVR